MLHFIGKKAFAVELKPSFTPVKSPLSSGISEAFVKTLKRDYIKIANFPDFKSALRQINGWIKDYMKSIRIPRSI
ncbi:Integrase [Bartonella apis]